MHPDSKMTLSCVSESWHSACTTWLAWEPCFRRAAPRIEKNLDLLSPQMYFSCFRALTAQDVLWSDLVHHVLRGHRLVDEDHNDVFAALAGLLGNIHGIIESQFPAALLLVHCSQFVHLSLPKEAMFGYGQHPFHVMLICNVTKWMHVVDTMETDRRAARIKHVRGLRSSWLGGSAVPAPPTSTFSSDAEGGGVTSSLAASRANLTYRHRQLMRPWALALARWAASNLAAFSTITFHKALISPLIALFLPASPTIPIVVSARADAMSSVLASEEARDCRCTSSRGSPSTADRLVVVATEQVMAAIHRIPVEVADVDLLEMGFELRPDSDSANAAAAGSRSGCKNEGKGTSATTANTDDDRFVFSLSEVVWFAPLLDAAINLARRFVETHHYEEAKKRWANSQYILKNRGCDEREIPASLGPSSAPPTNEFVLNVDVLSDENPLLIFSVLVLIMWRFPSKVPEVEKAVNDELPEGATEALRLATLRLSYLLSLGSGVFERKVG